MLDRIPVAVAFICLALFAAACTSLPPQLIEESPADIRPPQPPSEQPKVETRAESGTVAAEQPKQPELKVVKITGDLIINDSTYILHRTRLYLYGNLIVNRTGRLIASDSEIHFAQDYNQQFRAYVRENATLDMGNVRLFTGRKWFNFEYNGRANVIMRNVKGEDCCTPWHGASENVKFDIADSTIGLTINSNVTVTVRNRSSMFFELVLTGVQGEFRLPRGYVGNYRLSIKNSGSDEMKVAVDDSSFDRWGTTLDKHTDITFTDSHLTIGINAGSDWELPSPTVKVSGLKAKKYDDYTLDFDTNRLHLVNTEVTSWYPQAWNGATIELEDSDLADLQNNGRDSKLIVRNSKVDIAIARENVVQEYYGSEIRQDVIVHDDAEIRLYNTKVGGRILENGNGKVFVDGRRNPSR